MPEVCCAPMIMRTLLFSGFMAVASFAFGAMPAVNVSVIDASGKVAFKGKTGAGGTFATGKLQPGDYIVQFNGGGMPSGNYALVVSAGKQKVMAEAVAGEKFGKGGVAMKIKVSEDVNLTGQVSSGKVGAVAATASSGSAKVKIVNGKRWFWVNGSTGSNLGGHWVEEGSAEAQNVQNLSTSAVNRIQERGAAGLSGN